MCGKLWKRKESENKNLEFRENFIPIKPEELNNQYIDSNLPKDIKNMTNLFEKVFSENERKYIRRMFWHISDGVTIY